MYVTIKIFVSYSGDSYFSFEYKKGNQTFNCKLDEPTLLDRGDQVIHEGPINTEEQKNIDLPIDCKWDDWRYGECSQTCGGGTQINIRNKVTEAAHGGKECSGKSTSTATCNEQPCPGK